jgi:hypothetical protein
MRQGELALGKIALLQPIWTWFFASICVFQFMYGKRYGWSASFIL